MNIQAMMQQAKKMQKELEEKKNELKAKEFKIEKQGIELTIKGDRTISKLKIHDALIDIEDKDTLEDMIIITINEANKLISEKEDEIQPNSPTGMPI